MNNTQTERMIRIYDLFLALCQRWRSLIICFVIGALVLGAYGWWKSGQTDALTDATVDAAVAALGSGRKETIEGYASEYVASVEQITKQSEYNKKAVLMQLDPFHLSVYEVKYYISNNGEEGSNVNLAALAQAYISELQKDYLGQKVKATMEGEDGVLQRELYESTNLIQIDTKDITSGILTFRIYSQDTLPETDASELKNQVRTAQGRVWNTVGEHSMMLIGESSFVTADMDILLLQAANVQRIEDLTERIENIQKAVADTNEKQYLNYLIKKEINKGESADFDRVSRHLSKKYILIGAFLGLILAAVVIIIKYVSSNTIKTGKEVEEDFKLQVLGRFDGKDPFYQKRKTGLDKWLRSLRIRKSDKVPYEEMIDLVATKIRIEAEKRDLQQVCLIVDGKVTGNTDFIEAIIQKVGAKPAIQVISNILEQSGALAGASGMDGAIIVGQIEKTRFDDVQSICSLCANYQVDVIGSILLD